jgi:hypothetical protein
MTPIPQHLIESALALCGKTMEEMSESAYFDYPKFFYFLLSPEFLLTFTGNLIEIG